LYAELDRSTDEVFDQLVGEAANGENFYSSMERVESQLAAAAKMLSSQRDLDLNETSIMADKISAELESAEKYALGAALVESEEAWATELEAAKAILEKLSGRLRKMKHADSEGEALEARSHMLSFRKDAKLCQQKLALIRGIIESRKHPAYSKLRSAKARISLLRASVGKAFDRISKARLRKRIDEAKSEILGILRRFGSARVFVDHKHLTISRGSHVERMPLTQSVRFALEEMAPVEKSLAKLGRNGTVLLGEYDKNNGDALLRIGERTVTGDTIIFREKTFKLG